MPEPLLFGLLGIVVAGIALGLSLAVPPGPVNAIIAVQSSSRSAFRGFLVGLGAMTADSIFLVITFSLGSLIVFDSTLRAAFYMVSFALMLLLAWLTFRSLKGLGKLMGNNTRGGHLPYVTGLTIGLTNPLQITWWLSVGLSLISSIGLVIIMGFFAGILLWITLFPITMHWASSRIPSLYKYVVYASTILLFAFAGWFLYSFIALLL
jgi:threonine/homoserine/homoserine lactone efflux protein